MHAWNLGFRRTERPEELLKKKCPGPQSQRAEVAETALKLDSRFCVYSLTSVLNMKSWLEVESVVLSRGFCWVYFELA